MTATFLRQAWVYRVVWVLLVFFACVGQAEAGLDACYELKSQFSPNDVALAYQFAKEHGSCIAHFEDPAFQTVAGTLTSLTATGVLHAGQCTSLMSNTQSPAAQQLFAVADAGVVSNYLSCGCAVADSGIANKIKTLVEDVVSCAQSFDPTGPISSGMKKAGDALGLSTLWGLAGSAHDPRAGQGNGGAPTESYWAPNCPATGMPIAGRITAWSGAPLEPGLRVQTCICPPPTRVYADNQFIQFPGTDYGGVFHTPTFSCLVCPPGTARDKYGNCSHCLNKSGPNGFEIWSANRDGSACELTRVDPINPCKAGENWNGLGGSAAVCCASWQVVSGDKNSCQSRCVSGRVWNGSDCTACAADTEQVDNSCQACPENSHSQPGRSCVADLCPPGQGVMPDSNQCMACPPDTELKQGGYCMPCTQGAHSEGGSDFCKIIGFGGVSCPAGTVHPPGDNISCVCAPGTQEVNGVCQPVLRPRPIIQRMSPTRQQ